MTGHEAWAPLSTPASGAQRGLEKGAVFLLAPSGSEDQTGAVGREGGGWARGSGPFPGGPQG